MSRPFRYKVDYEGDTVENNFNTDNSQSENEMFVKKLGQRKKVKNNMMNSKNTLLWLIKQILNLNKKAQIKQLLATPPSNKSHTICHKHSQHTRTKNNIIRKRLIYNNQRVRFS